MTAIRMLETRKGTEDGFTIKEFYEGQNYDVREGLARSFFLAGYAEKQVKKDSKKKSQKRKPKQLKLTLKNKE